MFNRTNTVYMLSLNLRKRKSCSYNLHENNISKHTEILSKDLDFYSSQYESNIGVSNPHNNDFRNAHNLSSLINEPTCYKNPNLSCIHFAPLKACV